MIDTLMLIICFVVASVAVFSAYRQGIKDGRKIAENKPLEPVINVPKVQHQTKETKEAIKRYNAICANIDNYNGTAEGQKKVN